MSFFLLFLRWKPLIRVCWTVRYGCWMNVLLPNGWFGYPVATLAVDEFWAVVSTSNAVGFVLSAYFMWRAKRQLYQGNDPNLSADHRSMRALTRDQLSRQASSPSSSSSSSTPSPPRPLSKSTSTSATTSIVKLPRSRSPGKVGNAVRFGSACPPVSTEKSPKDLSLRRSPRFTPQKTSVVGYTAAAVDSASDNNANRRRRSDSSSRGSDGSSRGKGTDATVKSATYNDNRSLSPAQHSSPRRPLPPPPPVMAATGSGLGQWLSDFYAGLDFNPRLFRDRSFDVKMWLYLVCEKERVSSLLHVMFIF